MRDRKSYLNHEERVNEFEVGDKVLLPIFTRGNRFAPPVGRVTAVLDDIGFLDVQTSFGNIRLSPFEVERDGKFDPSDPYLQDRSLDTWDRRNASARKVASKYYDDRLRGLIKLASRLREDFDFSGPEAYDFIFSKHSSKYADEEIKQAVKTAYKDEKEQAEEMTKDALYWKDKGRKYSPSKEEIEEGVFKCPRCKCELEKAHYKKNTPLYACPDCLWLIRPSDLLDDQQQDEEPESLDEEDGAVDFFDPDDPLLKEIYQD